MRVSVKASSRAGAQHASLALLKEMLATLDVAQRTGTPADRKAADRLQRRQEPCMASYAASPSLSAVLHACRPATGESLRPVCVAHQRWAQRGSAGLPAILLERSASECAWAGSHTTSRGCARLLHDDQKESGFLPVLARLIKGFSHKLQPLSHAGDLVETLHLVLRLLERLSRQGALPGCSRRCTGKHPASL